MIVVTVERERSCQAIVGRNCASVPLANDVQWIMDVHDDYGQWSR